MAVDLSDHTASLVRAVTPMGGSITASTATLTGYLTDAFWEARLDGFMTGYVADEDGVVTPLNPLDPDLDRRWVALIILYASMKALTNAILTLSSGIRAKAGPVEFEQQNSASTMTEMLKQLRASKDRLLADLREDGGTAMTDVMLVDAYLVREWHHLGRSYTAPHLLGS